MTVDTAHRAPGRRPLAALALIAAAVAPMPAVSQELVEALAITHDTNPTLIAQRQALREKLEEHAPERESAFRA